MTTLNFGRWVNRETRAPVARVSVTFVVERRDLVSTVARRIATPDSYPDVPSSWTRASLAEVLRSDLAMGGDVHRDAAWTDDLDRYAEDFEGRVAAVQEEADAIVVRCYPELITKEDA